MSLVDEPSRRARPRGGKAGRALAWLLTALAMAYAAGVILWAVSRWIVGDRIWWLALGNAFAPLAFTPLLALLPLCLVIRRRAFRIAVGAPLLIFLLLYGALFLPRLALRRGGEQTLRVMTFNIWGGSETAETARAIVQNGAIPDVVALQELTPAMGRILIDELITIYPYHQLAIHREKWGCGLLSRYPLHVLPSTQFWDPEWAHTQVLIAEVEAPGQPVTIYNVHLTSSHILAYLEEGRPIPQTVEASVRHREQVVRLLLEDIRTRTTPVIVMGDLNATEQSQVYRLLASELRDAYRAAGWGLGHSFPAYAGSYHGIPIPSRLMRIDMVWASRDLAPRSARLGRIYGESDHLPLIVDLAILPPQAD